MGNECQRAQDSIFYVPLDSSVKEQEEDDTNSIYTISVTSETRRNGSYSSPDSIYTISESWDFSDDEDVMPLDRRNMAVNAGEGDEEPPRHPDVGHRCISRIKRREEPYRPPVNFYSGATAAFDEEYEINSDPVGLCLIINNTKFPGLDVERKGTQQDMADMVYLFERFWEFEVNVGTNLTANGMREALSDHARNASEHRYSALAVVLMSHGGDFDDVYGTNADFKDRTTAISRDELMQYFSTESCPAMRGKPKLFIVHTCTGDFDVRRNLGKESDFQGSLGTHMADMSFLHSSSSGYVSSRNAVRGSKFIRKFKECMEADAATNEYSKIVKKTAQELRRSNIGNRWGRCFTEVMSTFTKQLYLRPARHCSTVSDGADLKPSDPGIPNFSSVPVNKESEEDSEHEESMPQSPIPEHEPVQCVYDQVQQTSSSSECATSDPVGTLMLPHLAGNPLSVYSTKYNENPDEVYRMDSLPRGSCLIINNQRFYNLSFREGSDKDMINLAKLFGEHLGFDVTCEENQTVLGMQELLERHAHNASSHHCALAVVIMSHGGRHDGTGIIYGKDGKVNDGVPVRGTYIEEPELLQYFTGTKCPAMRGKPKLFIIQACRGFYEDIPTSGNREEELENDSSQTGGNRVEKDGDTSETDNPSGSDTADTHIVFSSSPGYLAYRHTLTGSAFVEKYIQNMKRHAGDMEYDNIMKKVRNHFNSTALPNGAKIMPFSTTSLLKDLYLNPVL